MIKKIAFIDHSFHQKTKSSNFLIELLAKRYNVDLYYDTFWQDKVKIDFNRLNKIDYVAVVFWQVSYNLCYISKLKCKNIIYIPMYDDFLSNTVTPFYWRQFSGVKFISFSHALHEYLSNLRLNSLEISYFPEPHEIKKDFTSNNLTAFFWYRVGSLSWDSIKKLILPSFFEKIYIQNSPDPLQPRLDIPDDDIVNYNIVLIDWFGAKDEYINFLKSVDIYFAPRKTEGIGLSFLEAMSYGLCVVAYDLPTMNEYIVHEKNGFLFDDLSCQMLNISKIKYEDIVMNNSLHYRAYKKRLPSLFELIEKPVCFNPTALDYLYYVVDKIFYIPFKIFTKIFK